MHSQIWTNCALKRNQSCSFPKNYPSNIVTYYCNAFPLAFSETFQIMPKKHPERLKRSKLLSRKSISVYVCRRDERDLP